MYYYGENCFAHNVPADIECTLLVLVHFDLFIGLFLYKKERGFKSQYCLCIKRANICFAATIEISFYQHSILPQRTRWEIPEEIHSLFSFIKLLF